MTFPYRKTGTLALAALLAGPALQAGNAPSCGKRLATTGILLALASVGQTLAVEPPGAPPAPLPAPGQVLFTPPGLEPMAAPDFLDLARRAYRNVNCPTVGHADMAGPASHCQPGQAFASGLSPAEADGLAMTMADPWVIEEEILGPGQRAVLDLEDCVCRALRQHERSDAPDRDAVLFARLRDTKEQLRALSQALKDNASVRKSLQASLKKDRTLWHDPGEYVVLADPGLVRHPGRVEMTLVADAPLLVAKKKYENTILPLLVDLKRDGRHRPPEPAKAR